MARSNGRQPELAQFLTEFATDDDREKFTSGDARRLFGIDSGI